MCMLASIIGTTSLLNSFSCGSCILVYSVLSEKYVHIHLVFIEVLTLICFYGYFFKKAVVYNVYSVPFYICKFERNKKNGNAPSPSDFFLAQMGWQLPVVNCTFQVAVQEKTVRLYNREVIGHGD
uniref:Uncharacterized protein n=1 Tax=Oryza brachyantha TaxID=4533 RepID=J3MJA1_ORYBR